MLDIGGFPEGGRGKLWAEALEKADDERRKKAERIPGERARAACLGAGLLLQLAVREAGCPERGRAGTLPGGETGPETRGGHRSREAVRIPLRCLEVRELLDSIPARLPLQYTYGQKGKPYLRDYPYFFSISHSGDYVLCVLAEEEVGADIQRMQPMDFDRLARRFFAETEAKALAERTGAEKERLFYELWAKKEALGKLTGRGAAAVLETSVLERSEAENRKQPEPDEAEESPEWLELAPPEGYAAAVCRGKEGKRYG